MKRRGFIRLVGGGLAAGTVLPLLAACVPTSPSTVRPAAAGTATGNNPGGSFPTFRPSTSGPKPDFASSGPQYEDGFSNYPKENPKSWTKNPPGTASNISVLSQARGVGSSTPMTPLEQNPAWKEVNRQLNANVTFTVTPSQDYQAKLAAVMSGSDLPDIILFQGGLGSTNATSSTVGASSTTNLPAFLEHSMADLTPYLGGDAANDYPNLAAIPTFAWKNSGCMYTARSICGRSNATGRSTCCSAIPASGMRRLAPTTRPRTARTSNARCSKSIDRAKIATPSSAPMCSTTCRSSRPSFGAPNGWALNNGKLTRDIETPEYREAIAYVKDLVDSGLYYPDSLINPATNAGGNTFVQGKGAIFVYTFGVNWSTLWSQSQAVKPSIDFMPLPLFPAHAGGKPGHFLGPGFIVTNGMKKAPPERIQEILRVVDWLAAPFGSAEDLLLTYGIKDVEYTLDANGHPVQNKGAAADTQSVPWQYIVQHPQVMFFPNYPDYAKLEYNAEHMLIPAGIEDPTWGYFSNASSTQGPVISQMVIDTLTDILVGRSDMSAYDEMVKDWQARGGNQIRSELEAAIASAA